MRLVTVTDRKFFIGTAVLLYSIVRNGLPPAGWSAIVVHEDLTEWQIGYLARICDRLELVELSSLPPFELPAHRLSPRRKGRLKKLSIFKLFERGKLCYLDSDMLCLGSIAELASFPHFSAAADTGQLAGRPLERYLTFNSGLMVFEPTPDFARELQAFCRPEHFEKKADQYLLNEFMYAEKPADVHIVHSMFNTLVSVAGSSPGYFAGMRAAGIRLFHFTNTKPWQDFQGGLRGVRDRVLERAARRAAQAEFAAWHDMAREMEQTFGPAADE